MTETVKPGYKQTEVGVIPEDWEVSACADVCVKIQDGTHFSPSLGGNDYLYIITCNNFNIIKGKYVKRIT